MAQSNGEQGGGELREKILRHIQNIVWETAEVAVDRANENGGEVNVSGTNFEAFVDDVMSYVAIDRKQHELELLDRLEGQKHFRGLDEHGKSIWAVDIETLKAERERLGK